MPAEPDSTRPYYRVDPNIDRYIPNHIPASERWWYLGLSLAILGWGSYGLWANDLMVPVGKRGHVVHLHGTAAMIMFLAMVFAALNMITVIVDHFDIRNNELAYRRIAFGTQLAGWLLFASALVVHFWR